MTVPERLADRLQAARHRHFVGRVAERALFRAALLAPELPFSVLYLYGPGGIGKTSLLREFARLCVEHQIAVVTLDARELEPSPEPLLAALRGALALAPDASLPDALGALGRAVVLLDTYEALAPLDAWLRDYLLPELPAQTLVVLAGRQPPSPGWRSDAGWQQLLRAVPLHNLSPDESRLYLQQRNLPLDQHFSVLQFTHGHPLALSLVADTFAQRPNVTFAPEDAPDVVKTLLERFVQKVPSPAHRAALEICALVRLTSEPLLSELMRFPDVGELFEWLRGLSFVEVGREGLLLHDLAREALVADLRWRNPVWHAELHARARAYYNAQLQRVSRRTHQRVLLDYIFLHRDNAVVRPFYTWNGSGGLADIARPSDWAALHAMVTEHEGAASATIAAHWFARQPAGVTVFRDEAQQPIGFVASVALDQADQVDRAADPATDAALCYLEQSAPLRPGEVATLFRFWMARDTYQAVSAVQSLVFVHAVQHYLTTPGLAWTFFPCAQPDFWAPLFAYADLARLPAADFVVGERWYGTYGHDWRVVSPTAWLALLAERETSSPTEAATPTQLAPQRVVLNEDEFVAAVRAALRDIHRPGALLENPLLRSRLVVEQSGVQTNAAERVSVLQALLRDACAALHASPRDAKLARVLYHVYLVPAATQEQAAEALDLPFSTFRRYLKNAVALVAEQLWQRELQAL